LLRCINRLIEPTEGQIVWDGVDITKVEPGQLRQIRRQIGMIFQHFNLVRRSNVITNVLSGRLGYVNPWRSLLHRFPAEDREMARAALERVGIADQAYKRADELSGGQQQRVGIARALMQQPRMILADEPVASLDPVLAHSILEYLEQLNQEESITILCSLHYLDLVQRYATRVIGLRGGQIVYRGTREEIRAMTDDEFKEIYGKEAVRVSVGPKGELV
jgi:phosphonate transport system ATP-binding protein